MIRNINEIKSYRSVFDAFTLAEVLITLGIIGVVAAITIPTLMQNTQDAQYKSAAKEAYSKTSQAIQQIKMDEDGTLSKYVGNSNSFKPVFMNYFKIIKDCNWGDCVPTTGSSAIYKSLTGEAADTNEGGEGQFVTADGMFFNIQNGGGAYIFITVDVNGYIQKPNVYGRDVFMFQITNNTLFPMGAGSTDIVAPTYCNRTTASTYQGYGCMYYVVQGINY